MVRKNRRSIIDQMHAGYEAAQRNARSREWIDPESYEEGSDPVYEAWKNVEQGRRLKRDVARLQREEKDNYPRIIEKQNELIRFQEEYLKKSEDSFYELKEFYERILQDYKEKYDQLEHRLITLESKTDELLIEVNNNTEQLNRLISEINEEKARVSKLARKACEDVITSFNRIVEERICSKFCYYKVRGLERIISRFKEPKISVDALYALAVDALGCLAEIESQSELEWKKFQPLYEPFTFEVLNFVDSIEECRHITLEDWNETIDVNFWTDNYFNELVANANQLKSQVFSGEFAMDYVASDIQLDKETLSSLKNSLQEQLSYAKNRASNAYHRQALAVGASEYLMNNDDFIISVCQFEEEDMRNDFIVEAHRITDEIKIILILTSNGLDVATRCYFLHNQYIDYNEYETIVNDILSSLRKECGIICINKDTSINLRYDEDTLIDGKLNESISNVINNQNNKDYEHSRIRMA